MLRPRFNRGPRNDSKNLIHQKYILLYSLFSPAETLKSLSFLSVYFSLRTLRDIQNKKRG
jgi:hypothetical protein